VSSRKVSVVHGERSKVADHPKVLWVEPKPR